MSDNPIREKTGAGKAKKIPAGPMVQNLGAIMRKAGIRNPFMKKKGASHGKGKSNKV